jgi:hypothetical protein
MSSSASSPRGESILHGFQPVEPSPHDADEGSPEESEQFDFASSDGTGTPQAGSSGFGSPLDLSFHESASEAPSDLLLPLASCEGSPLLEPLDEAEPTYTWWSSPTCIEVSGYAAIVAGLLVYFLLLGTPSSRRCPPTNRSDDTAASVSVVSCVPAVMDNAAEVGITQHRATASSWAPPTPALEASEETTDAPCLDCGILRLPHLVPFLDTEFLDQGTLSQLGLQRIDQPYAEGNCMATAELWAPLEAAFGPSTMAGERSCLGKIEPLDGTLPLRVGQDGEQLRCAKNQRRFKRASARSAMRFLDPDEVARRVGGSAMKGYLTPPCGPAPGGTRKLIVAGNGGDMTKVDWFMRSYVEPEQYSIYTIDPRQNVGATKASVGAFTTNETTEQHGDGAPRLKSVPKFVNAALWNETGFISFAVQPSHKQDIPSIVGAGEKMRGAAFHQSLVNPAVRKLFDQHDIITTVPALDADSYIRRVADAGDFVVFILDADGMEWAIAEHLARTGAWSLVDEVFVECHNGEWLPNWPTRHSPADCHRLINSLRAHGVYAHEWFD